MDESQIASDSALCNLIVIPNQRSKHSLQLARHPEQPLFAQ
jgi:hypothetical protein